MSDICIARYEAFGAAGSASKIKVMPLEKMWHQYQSGQLQQQVVS